MNPKHLSALRSHELETVVLLLHRHGMHGGRLLEIGAGTGQQARVLASRGYGVNAIDTPHSRFAPDFERNGFHVEEVVPSRLTYSGYALLVERLPMDFRARLAPFLGSACNIFILRHTGPNSAA